MLFGKYIVVYCTQLLGWRWRGLWSHMACAGENVRNTQFKSILVSVVIFFVFILAVVGGMNIKNSANLRAILTDSVKSQLISTSLAAREMLDVEAFMEYEDVSVADIPAYKETLAKFRALADSVGAKYIYALKKLDSEYVFVFDTDTEDQEIFIPYELSPVHEAAFAGRNAADIMNVSDEYGSFNTGAVPIMHRGRVVGIICTDIEDAYLETSYAMALRNSMLLIGGLVLTMAVMFYAVLKLLRRIEEMQDKLRQLALYDNITGLPNRQYLMEHLARLTANSSKEAFGLIFIDLDNFKLVNDNAGHDAGDDLLRSIAKYLDSALDNAKSFRPSAGQLNIAARVGGDEFIQVVNGLDTAEKAAHSAEQLLAGFKTEKVSRFVEKYNVGLSIGIALYPHDTENYHVLIKYADIAMYNAKRGGKNQYRVYDDEMGQEKI